MKRKLFLIILIICFLPLSSNGYNLSLQQRPGVGKQIKCKELPVNYWVALSLYDKDGFFVEESTGTVDSTGEVIISISTSPLWGYFEVEDKEGNLVLKTPVKERWGGDIYYWTESEPPVCVWDSVKITSSTFLPGEMAEIMAIIDDTGRGDEDIVAAEYFIDTVGLDGTGKVMSAADGIFNHYKEKVTATLYSKDTRNLCPGKHTIWVHGKDVSGLWGDCGSGEFTIAAPAEVKWRNTLFYPATQQKFMVSYTLKEDSAVKIVIYNLAGERMTTLVDEDQTAGTHTAEWDGRDKDGRMVASGEYLVYVNIKNEEKIGKVLVIR